MYILLNFASIKIIIFGQKTPQKIQNMSIDP